jgi:hypothetical protein
MQLSREMRIVSPVSSVSSRRIRPGGGYTLVAVVIIFTVMTILVAAVLPSWTAMIQRDKEEELVFEVRPRCIRQLWKEPMSEDGQWGLIFAQAAPDRRGRRRGRRETPAPDQQDSDLSRQPRELSGAGAPSGRASERRGGQTTGPVIGVRSLSPDSGFRSFFGSTQYNQWQFAANILPAVSILPGNANLTRANSKWVGRPFPEGLAPQQGGVPQPAQGGLPGEPRQPRRRRNERNDRDG